MIKVLFVGNFLSKSLGTYGVSEQIAESLPEQTFNVSLTSRKKNQVLRLFDIVIACACRSYQRIQIDTYSGPAFIIAEAASFIAKARGFNPILTLHGGMLPEFYSKNPHRLKRVIKRASYVQTPSLYLKDFFNQQGLHVNYLPNPINLDRFPYNRVTVKPHTLLWVRAFARLYNPELAVRTLYKVRKSFPDATLTMVGPDKGLLQTIKRLILKLGLHDSVIITGPIDNRKLYSYYQSHAVYLNTTAFESFGVAVVEAASCGIPIISTKVGEIPYVWSNKEDILLAEEINPNCFAEMTIKLFENNELANKLSFSARKKAETFDWGKIQPQWIRLLTEIE